MFSRELAIVHFIKRIWRELSNIYMLLFRQALVINAYVDTKSWVGISSRNWGDDLNYYFLKIISNRPVVIYQSFWLARKLKLKNYLCIGTLLDAVNYSNRSTVVWGTGVSGQDRDFVFPKKICSVRGRKTYEFLKNRGIECPSVFGDPALLLPRFYTPQRMEKRYKLGIIPHVIDWDYDVMRKIRKERNDTLVIDLAHYDKWTDVIDQICSCEAIASSSLHGLIVSDAYNVPNCWITLSGKISGGLFKFFDYFSSVGREEAGPEKVERMSDLQTIESKMVSWKPITIDTVQILNSCPFYKA